ncbi:DsrE family protein [Lactiplantibacillus herbarum]|uniref:DsrE family protein n=1 Tax=Lactiplantibacillus herbarum TaxID=1670446 RepID=UPI000ABB40DA|nr:DsrE family protein [Lactiplantibacillus herbarum]
MLKVVIHVDEIAKVTMAIGNCRNLLAVEPTASVVMVVNGPAITTLTTGMWQPLLIELPQITVDACHNAMVSHQVAVEDLAAGVTVVPAGVVRIVELQNQGYAYLKP